jgi:hypothetical protein
MLDMMTVVNNKIISTHHPPHATWRLITKWLLCWKCFKVHLHKPCFLVALVLKVLMALYSFKDRKIINLWHWCSDYIWLVSRTHGSSTLKISGCSEQIQVKSGYKKWCQGVEKCEQKWAFFISSTSKIARFRIYLGVKQVKSTCRNYKIRKIFANRYKDFTNNWSFKIVQ